MSYLNIDVSSCIFSDVAFTFLNAFESWRYYFKVLERMCQLQIVWSLNIMVVKVWQTKWLRVDGNSVVKNLHIQVQKTESTIYYHKKWETVFVPQNHILEQIICHFLWNLCCRDWTVHVHPSVCLYTSHSECRVKVKRSPLPIIVTLPSECKIRDLDLKPQTNESGLGQNYKSYYLFYETCKMVLS